MFAMNFSDRFDPFNDRLSRDVRNSLSEAFVETIKHLENQPLDACRIHWLQQNLPPAVEHYLIDRSQRYRSVMNTLKSAQVIDPSAVTAAFWNQELFFELHEYLEDIWTTETGQEREALKGMIQAAGAYVHREHHNRRAAARLAAKAVQRLSGRNRRLKRIANLDELCRCLENLSEPPPRLLLQIK